MNLNKFLYEFTVNKEEEVEKSEISKNEKNEEIRIVKKEIIKNPISVRIIKPDRKLFDDAELFYGVQLSVGIKSGLLTRSLLAKRYQNDGGALSDPEKEQYANLYKSFCLFIFFFIHQRVKNKLPYFFKYKK